ncbi:MAG: hypothetical protein R3181_10690 [Rubricoccaceae bacterium]|nr:hypothetical protein [Rubricoccaceae bacterium]
MKPTALVQALEEAHRRLGVAVRRDRGAFRGGRCVVAGEEVVVLNKRHPAEAQVAILAESLRTLPHDQVYLRPAVRAALEDAWAAGDAGPVVDGEPEDA